MTLDPTLYFEIANDEKTVEKLARGGYTNSCFNAATSSLDPLDTFKRWLKLTGEITGTTERPEEITAEAEANQKMITDTLEEAGIKEEDKPRVMFLQYHSEGEIQLLVQTCTAIVG